MNKTLLALGKNIRKDGGVDNIMDMADRAVHLLPEMVMKSRCNLNSNLGDTPKQNEEVFR